jgi:hypothetical protein
VSWRPDEPHADARGSTASADQFRFFSSICAAELRISNKIKVSIRQRMKGGVKSTKMEARVNTAEAPNAIFKNMVKRLPNTVWLVSRDFTGWPQW